MKVSNNALNFLLAQYRAIFKRAYVKGLASAVMLTAALAAGQAQAALDDSKATDLANGDLILIINTGTAADNTTYYDSVTISGGGSANTWNANVIVQSGATTENKIEGSAGAVNITGDGSLTIEVADNFDTKGLAINAHTSNDTSVSIGSIAVNKGTLAITDAASHTATVSAQSITIGKDPASESTPAVLAASDPGILSLTASGNGGSVTLGTAGETSIEVKSTGQLKVTLDSGTATINGTALTLNDKAFMLVANGANKGNTLTVASDTFTIAQDAVHVISSEAAGKAVTEQFTGSTATIGGNVLIAANSTLDLSTNITDETKGVVTLADGSNTVVGGTITVNKGTLEVAADANLNASSTDGIIKVLDTGSDKSVLKISADTLKSYLTGSGSYKDIDADTGAISNTDGNVTTGKVHLSGSVLDLTSSEGQVDLAEFKFKTTDAAETIRVESESTIKGNNILISKQISDGSSGLAGASSNIKIEATSLTLGNNNAAVTDYGFKSAKVANLYNDAKGAITLGNPVTLDVTVGNSSTTIDPNEDGVFSGDFVLSTAANSLTVEQGTYTHNGSLTIKNNGVLNVQNTVSSKVNTKLTLTNLDLQAGTGTSITVDGKNNDAATTVLDISSAEFTVSGGTSSGTITVQSGGTFVATGKQVQDILNADGAKGFAVTLNKGTLEVTDSLKLDVTNNLASTGSAAEDKILMDSSSNGGNIKVNGELALTSADTLNFDKSTFSADKLTLETASAASKLQAGTYTVWSGLNSKNGVEVSGATLLLGGFDENGDAISSNGTLKTNLNIKEGTVTVQNGSWNGSSQTLTVAGGEFTVGDAEKVDAAGNTFATSLSLNKIEQTGASATTTISTVGSVETNSLTVSDGTFTVNGSMTVKGKIDSTVNSETPAKYGVALAADKIVLGENANLTFGADATKAITVRDAKDETKGWISAVNGTFGNADPATTQTVIDAAVGSTVTFEFAEGTSFSSAALAEFRKEIFGVAEGGNLDGFVNLGSATIDGLTVENGEVAWSDLQGLIDVGDLADFTTQDLLTAKVTGITSDAELRGSLGSLSSAEHTAGGQIAVDGNLTLNNAAGNDGAFASNTAGAVLGLNVTENARVTLNNGGEIGKVTFSSKGGSFVVAAENGTTKIAEIDGAHASTQFNAGTTTVTGETETAQLTTAAGTNTTFGGDVIVGQSVAENATSSLEGDTTFNGAATFAKNVEVKSTGTATFTKDVTFQGAASFYGDTTVEGTATAENGFTVDQGAAVAINKLITSGDVFVGSVEGEKAGAGTLSITTLNLGGNNLVVDPAWDNATGLSFAGVDKFTTDNTVHTDAGVLDGGAYALQNAILSIGNSNKDEVVSIFGKFINAQGNLSNASDGVGSIVYVADTVEVATGGKIVADKTKTESTFKPADYTTALFIGDNSVLGVEVSAATSTDASGAPKAAITFADDVTVDASNSGKIVLTGDYDQSDRINLMADEGGNGTVDIANNGTITVETINGLLTFTYNGQEYFNISDMHVETERAESAFSATSSPVHESLVAYGTGNTDWRNEGKQTADEKKATKTHGAVRSDIILHTDGEFYYKPEVEGEAPTKLVDDKLADRLTTINVLNPDYVEGSTDPKTSSKYIEKVAYKAYNPLLSAINNVQANNGISAESAARMADFAGVAQVALKAGNSTSDAISGRMGVGAQNSAITYANNGQGAGLWVTPIYMNSDSDGFEAQGISYGTDINLYGVALGGDYTLANGIRVGAMFNVGSGDVDGQGAGSNVSSDFDYYGFGLYAGYTMGQFSIVGDVSYTAVDNDVEANTEFADIGKLETSLDSSNISFGVTGAYAFDTAAGVKVTPHVGLRYSYIDIDDYTVGSKKGAIGSYSADSLSVFSIPVGVTIASEFNAGSWSVKPSFDLTLTGNFGDDENEGTFHWDGVENIDSGLTSEIFDNFTYGATLGVAAQSASGISLGLSVGYTGSSNVDDFGVNANARFTF